jgi:hypothetical protein
MAELTEDIVKWVKSNVIHGGPFDVSAWAEEWGHREGIGGIATPGRRAGIDDELDAFRHAFTSSVIVSWMPFGALDRAIADWLGQMNESQTIGGDSAEYCPQFMDLHNNRVGREITLSEREMLGLLWHFQNPVPVIAKRVADAVKAGKTINSFDDPRMPKQCHFLAKVPGGKYTWHTQMDDKVH